MRKASLFEEERREAIQKEGDEYNNNKCIEKVTSNNDINYLHKL